jgi:hypothetical protein
MAKAGVSKLLSIVFLVAGGGLVFWGYERSRGLESQVSSVLTGSHSDNVMLLYIGGAVCIAIGAFLLRK